ncbi:endonuclease IV [Candidatus Pacearchaeota archaeon]|nr:endonuclease IV [Candidatus Pacearchaeota archaeon]|tara:strand:- start:289 stop:1062 length:774 start_codon:yes stop_codon:yes gene_type:complete
MVVRFGPAGLGGVKDAVANLEEFHRLGIRACEISFTYGPYIKKEDAPAIRESAERLGIQLSIHAPYWINLNSDDAKKLDMSKRRILASCEVGEWLGVKYVVFHAGFYGKGSREEAYENIRDAIKEIMAEMKAREYKIKIAVETMGKINVFGSVSEIKRLVRDTGCSFCLDFAHLWARSLGKMSYEEMVDEFKEFDSWHCHFSGIVYGEKGERNHIPTPGEELKKLLSSLPKGKDITIINESPVPVDDSVAGLSIYKK